MSRRTLSAAQRRARRSRLSARRQAVDAAAHESWLSTSVRDLRTRWSRVHQRTGDSATLDLDFATASQVDLEPDADTLWTRDPGEAVSRARMRARWMDGGHETEGEG